VQSEEPSPTRESRAVKGPIVLTLPADTRMARIARLTATALGSMAGFSVDDSDDLRIGVDELVVMMVEGGDGADLTMRFEVTESEVRVSAQTPASSDGDPERFVLSEQILGVVADSYAVSSESGMLTASLTKRAS
jgi:serine/threonine-protein kinase RsbW